MEPEHNLATTHKHKQPTNSSPGDSWAVFGRWPEMCFSLLQLTELNWACCVCLRHFWELKFCIEHFHCAFCLICMQKVRGSLKVWFEIWKLECDVEAKWWCWPRMKNGTNSTWSSNFHKMHRQRWKSKESGGHKGCSNMWRGSWKIKMSTLCMENLWQGNANVTPCIKSYGRDACMRTCLLFLVFPSFWTPFPNSLFLLEKEEAWFRAFSSIFCSWGSLTQIWIILFFECFWKKKSTAKWSANCASVFECLDWMRPPDLAIRQSHGVHEKEDW